MIIHPVILIPKLVVIIVLVFVLVWLHSILTPAQWLLALIASILFLGVFFLFMLWLLARLASKPGSRVARGFVVAETSKSSEGYVAADLSKKSLVGKRGVTLCMMRPAGKVEIDGMRMDAVTDGEFIQKDCEVEVIQVAGNRVVVKPMER
jgi:membrane protein implicated in regulation of membrane protease activity